MSSFDVNDMLNQGAENRPVRLEEGGQGTVESGHFPAAPAKNPYLLSLFNNYSALSKKNQLWSSCWDC